MSAYETDLEEQIEKLTAELVDKDYIIDECLDTFSALKDLITADSLVDLRECLSELQDNDCIREEQIGSVKSLSYMLATASYKFDSFERDLIQSTDDIAELLNGYKHE